MSNTQDFIDLSIVIPVFNEQDVLPILKNALEHFFSSFQIAHEIIFVNDASTDRTEEILQKWHLENEPIRIIHLSENVGHQEAILIGIQAAEGNYIITMDADLQDPLEEIPRMLGKAHEGYEIIHMKRMSREGEPIFRRLSAWVYYRVFKIIYPKMLIDVGDFRLMTKNVVGSFLSESDSNVMLRKVTPSLPVSQTVLTYHRKKRIAGKSKFSFPKLLNLAFYSGTFRKKNDQ